MRNFNMYRLASIFLVLGFGLGGWATDAAPAEKHVLRGLTYARVGTVELKLDLHLPVHATKPLPVILWMHPLGGGRGFCPIANLAKEGFAVASVSYRVSGQAVFPAQIYDCKAAVRWLRANAATYQLDADHIGVAGESAGGHLAALLGVTGNVATMAGDVGDHLDQSSRVNAVVALCPPTDFTGLLGAARDRSFWAKLFTSGNLRAAIYTAARTHAVTQLFGGPPVKRATLLREASPVTWVSRESTPFLLFHGRDDPLIPRAQSEALAQRLRESGVEVRLEVVETSTHGFGRFPPEMMAATRLFFNQHLKAAPAVGATR